MPLNRITLERQDEIQNLIRDLELKTGLSYPENSLIEIIEAAIPDIAIVEDDFGGKSNIKGAVFRKGEEFEHPLIAVQSKQTAPSKTFVLAHEFGHYMLDHNSRENYYIDDRTYDGSRPMQDEGEANFFASMLLMPKNKFLELDQPFVTDKQLAERFGVTENNIRVRREWLEKNGF